MAVLTPQLIRNYNIVVDLWYISHNYLFHFCH